MKIGVDAGALGVTDERLKVGVYRVISNMLRVLGELDDTNQYYLYSFDPIDPSLMREFGPNMENRVLWPVKGWFRLRLPMELRLHPVDLFLATSQALPRTTTKTIGFVYDLGFLHHPSSYPGSCRKLVRQTKRLVQRADAIITISKSVKKDIEATYERTDSVSIAYPGISNVFTKYSHFHPDSRPYFLFVGALKKGKNIPTLIRSFAQFLSTEKMPYDLIVVGGDYWRDKNITSACRALRLQGRITFAGYVTDEKLAHYYRGAVALVSPSLHEGFCLPAVEAMASGCPVIGSKAPAMPEIIGKAGLLVNPHSVSEIAGAMAKVAGSKKLRTSLVQKGIIRSQKFSWETFGKSVLRVIRKTRYETKSRHRSRKVSQ
jgi:glycosyltransferase involved in cell wall biosynthesis